MNVRQKKLWPQRINRKTFFFCLQQKAKCSLEICVRLRITQVTNTRCTQGTYSFPISAIISEQAVDLILHEEGKTNIRLVTVMQISCIFLKAYWLQTISCSIQAIDILVTLPSWVFSPFAYGYWILWQQQEKLIRSNHLVWCWHHRVSHSMNFVQ